jgi:hypothetical protein
MARRILVAANGDAAAMHGFRFSLDPSSIFWWFCTHRFLIPPAPVSGVRD